MLPETHGPTILRRHARALRVQGHINAFSQQELGLNPAKRWNIVQNHLPRVASETVCVAGDGVCGVDAKIETFIWRHNCDRLKFLL